MKPDRPLQKPDPSCKHEQFKASVDVFRLKPTEHLNSPVRNHIAEVRVFCANCGGDFMFHGLPTAISLERPCLDVSATQASLPIKPWDGTLASGTTIEMPKRG